MKVLSEYVNMPRNRAAPSRTVRAVYGCTDLRLASTNTNNHNIADEATAAYLRSGTVKDEF